MMAIGRDDNGNIISPFIHPSDWVKEKTSDGSTRAKWDGSVHNQTEAEAKYGKGSYIGQSGTWHSNQGGDRYWQLNSNGSFNQIKPGSTSPMAITNDGDDPDGMTGTATAAVLPIAGTVALSDGPEPLTKGLAALSVAVALGYDATQRTFLTYYTIHPGTGEVYVGRTSGYGDPESILTRRWYNHQILRAQGFPYPTMDAVTRGIPGYFPIRGREQQLYDRFKLSGGIMKNAIRPVSPWNPFGRVYHEASNVWFGNIAPYTGYNMGGTTGIF